jgi:circadian clock protein KaiC
MTESALDRIETGVPGLDTILDGGLFRGGVYIVEGAPGSGKTILGNQICFHRAASGDRTVYITLLAESHTRLISHLRRMDFFKPELVGSSIYYISAFKVLEETGLDGLLKAVQQSVIAREATFVVLDGLVSAEEFSPSPRDFKKFIHELQTVTGMTGCTMLLLSSTERVVGFRPEHTMVDGIIELGDTLQGVQSLRHALVRKMRGTSQLRGRHSVEISNAGITIRPRIETIFGNLTMSTPELADAGPLGFDMPGLDAMLHGGVQRSSNTLLLGPSGSGKTMLGLQFLAAGARHDQSGLYVGFFERPAALLAKDARIGLGLRDAIDKHRVHLFWEAPIEGVLDAVVDRVLRAVAELGIKRLFFDGLHGFRHRAEYPERTRAVFSALADELARRNVTSLFSLELRELVGPSLEVPMDSASALADNLILLRHVELRAHLFRLISILKVRDHAYDGAIREFRITNRGLLVADTFESAEQILTGTARISDASE